MNAFIGCPWCHLRVQGCRCATACGQAHCVADTVARPPTTRPETSR
jgi:hypothetical protein